MWAGLAASQLRRQVQARAALRVAEGVGWHCLSEAETAGGFLVGAEQSGAGCARGLLMLSTINICWPPSGCPALFQSL